MALLDLESCCGLMGVKTGAYFIAIVNQCGAILGFVAWVSVGVLTATRAARAQADSHLAVSTRHGALLVLVAMGVVLTLTHVAMGNSLMRGLQKDEPRLVRRYLLFGSAAIFLNLLLVGLSAIFTYFYVAIPSTVTLGVEVYFMLVIRSAYRQMLQEENMLDPAVRHRREGCSIGGQECL